MNGTLDLIFKIIFFLALTTYIVVKEVLIPKRNHKKNNNPINLDRFYQEFRDFKEVQGKWNEKIEGKIEKLEEKK